MRPWWPWTTTLGLLLGGALALALPSCGHLTLKPDTNDPGCNPTDMVRDIDHKIHGVADCYICLGAKSCTAAGNHWCCAEPACGDCERSPVPFGHRRVPAAPSDDGGAK